jgi:hypothetical protein
MSWTTPQKALALFFARGELAKAYGRISKDKSSDISFEFPQSLST